MTTPATAANTSQIETDTFCATCGYNLHSLPVTLDERLRIPIVRCPECGSYHAAGHSTTAGRVWLSRLAMALITLWILFIVISIFLAGLGMFIVDSVQLEGFTMVREVTSARMLPSPSSPYGTTHYGSTHYVYERIPMTMSDFPSPAMWLLAWGTLLGFSVFAGYLLGWILVNFLWHIRRRWFLLSLVVPLLPAAIALLVWFESRYTRTAQIVPWTCRVTVLQIVLQCGGILLGLYIGRRISRFSLRVLLSPRLLQHFQFLWKIDHLSAPGQK